MAAENDETRRPARTKRTLCVTSVEAAEEEEDEGRWSMSCVISDTLMDSGSGCRQVAAESRSTKSAQPRPNEKVEGTLKRDADQMILII